MNLCFVELIKEDTTFDRNFGEITKTNIYVIVTKDVRELTSLIFLL